MKKPDAIYLRTTKTEIYLPRFLVEWREKRRIKKNRKGKDEPKDKEKIL